MARLDFVEPADDGNGAVQVAVRNPDEVIVWLSHGGETVAVSYWQLERITKRVREAFAFPLDPQQEERS